MKAVDNKMARFIEMLLAGFQSKENIGGPVPQQWQEGVMRSIRQIGPHTVNGWRSIDFVQLSWRLAPAAAVLTILLSIYILQTGATINHQMTTLTVSEPTTTYLAYIPF